MRTLKTRFHRMFPLVLVCLATAVPAQTPVVLEVDQSAAINTDVKAAELSPQERGELTKRLVNRWGAYLQRVYGIRPGVWVKRMAPTLARVDADNFREALTRDTFEGAMAALGGVGQHLSDAQAITKLASASGTKTLGALGNDLVYTPIPPCRIVDTRNTAAGAISANSTRSFVSVNAANFVSQGGSATNCETLGVAATAVAINLTAVTPTGAGYATAYPFGTAQPLAASVNYTAGAIVNNALIVQIPNPLSTADFTVYTFAQSHFVADIVGYFAPPRATSLECIDVPLSQFVPAGQNFQFQLLSCPLGYAITDASCASGFNEVNWAINGMTPVARSTTLPFCAGTNISANQIMVAGTTRCCRVPGR